MIWLFLIIAIVFIALGWVIDKNAKDNPQDQDLGQLLAMSGLCVIFFIIMYIA
jgi:hypothetical protein